MKPKFYENVGRRCAQTLIKSVATGETVSLVELDRLTGRKEGQVTTPVQIVGALHKLGVGFFYPVKSFFESASIDQIKTRTLGLFGDEIFSKTNFDFIAEALERLRKSRGCVVQRGWGLDRTKEQMVERRTPVCLINYDAYVGREEKRSGHYLVLNEINGQTVRVMDCGPCGARPNKEISIRRLENSLMQTPIDFGWVFI